MGLPLLPSIDVAEFDAQQCGLSTKSLSYLGSIYTTITLQNLNHAITFLQQHLPDFAVHANVTALPSIDDIVSLLDAGAAKIFVSYTQLRQLERVENVDLDRTVLAISSDQDETKDRIIDAIGDTPVGIYCHGDKDVDLAVGFLKEYGSDRPAVYCSLEQPTLPKLVDLAALQAIPIVPARQLTTDVKNSPSLLPISTILVSAVRSDRPDGLFTTLVTDERGVALGLVYSSAESVAESLRTGRGVYQSRKRGLWYKGESSGDVQELVRISVDCDQDCLRFEVRQKGRGNATCFGPYNGLSRLQQTLQSRKVSAPEGSYTARLFSSPQLLRAKIMEEAEELCKAESNEDIAFEAADLIYFALTKCVGSGVSLKEVERNLDAKSFKIKRRKGDAKGQWAEREGLESSLKNMKAERSMAVRAVAPPELCGDVANPKDSRVRMERYKASNISAEALRKVLQRPSQRSTDTIMGIVQPIVKAVRERGDAALLEYTHKFEKATSLTSPVMRAPFPPDLMRLPQETIDAIDLSFENIRKFHDGQKEPKPLVIETMPGVVCSRFSRPIERVGLYIPGGTAVLPSTALMLGVPALVAGCQKIVLASPPRADGSITPEIVYVAHKIGAEGIVLAGGAQAVAALAYGTETVSKVDKILGPGNQFVTAAKMLVSNDTSAGVSIDMPAGPSEVLVIADSSAHPAFVASDLLSQAEHGVDSQVILITVGLCEVQLAAIEEELHNQASALPRLDIVRGSIAHSVTLIVEDIESAMELSNQYAPEHLILQVRDAQRVIAMVQNAGSVFLGPWTPESVGDYSAGVNHSLPTYGYAKQYSGVNLSSYVKHITSSNLTAEGLRNLSGAVMQLAKVEELEAHRRAVSIRLREMDRVLSKE
ncbi:imidazoleglycerol-phosphate dehydratase [Glutinoglossum americanum]|uniref:Histidine biosynthesis trifunctional protein n=1 Tax=Glutinoglossum americanum TaxID=1670608 RepID=A0A9P8HSA2_9PEZI|nr:imidazoleglycerol-phosphate dehydratase [Glutinoglossum americanum]